MVRLGCTGCRWRAPKRAPRLLQQLHSLALPQNLVHCQWQSRHRIALAAPAPLSLHTVEMSGVPGVPQFYIGLEEPQTT